MIEFKSEREVRITVDEVAARRNADERARLLLSAMERQNAASGDERVSFLTARPDRLQDFRGMRFEAYSNDRHGQDIKAILDHALPMEGEDYVAAYVRDVSSGRVGPEGEAVGEEKWWVVADRTGRSLGIAGLYEYTADAPGHVWLNWFALRQDMQGTSLGSILLEYVMSHARRAGKKRIFMLTDDHASMKDNYKFYQREGCAVEALLDKTGVHIDAACALPKGVLQYLYKAHKPWIDEGVTWFLRSKAL